MRPAIDSNVGAAWDIRRREGSVGLVVFERDHVLLRRRQRLGDQALGDIDNDFLRMLQDMRNRNVRFGFVSHPTASPGARDEGLEGATLTRLLDGLLSVSGAAPDFWVESGNLQSESQTGQRSRRSAVDAILELAQWYGVDPTMTIVVHKRHSACSSKQTYPFTEIDYPGWYAGGARDSDRRAILTSLRTRIEHALKLP